MKNKILLFSLGISILATILALMGITQQPSIDSIDSIDSVVAAHIFWTSMKYYQVSGILGLLGISSFFVGLVFPKQ